MKLFGNISEDERWVNLADTASIAEELAEDVVCEISICEYAGWLLIDLFGTARRSHNVMLRTSQDDPEDGIFATFPNPESATGQEDTVTYAYWQSARKSWNRMPNDKAEPSHGIE